MDDLRCRDFFLQPNQGRQRHYEVLRAFFVERQPMSEIARRFGWQHGSVRNLVSRFRAECQAGTVSPFFSTPRAAGRVGAVPRREWKRQKSPMHAACR
jgi:hypothetical protein